MRWNLRMKAAERGIWKSAQMRRCLAEAGLEISAGKMSALWTSTSATIRLDDLDVICFVLKCTPSDLLICEPDQVRARKGNTPPPPANGIDSHGAAGCLRRRGQPARPAVVHRRPVPPAAAAARATGCGRWVAARWPLPGRPPPVDAVRHAPRPRGRPCRGFPPPPDDELAACLDQATIEHAARYSWSKTRLVEARQVIRILLGLQNTPGAPVNAIDVTAMTRLGFAVQPVLDILAGAGVFAGDRPAPIVRWFTGQTDDLPEPMASEVHIWRPGGNDGSRARLRLADGRGVSAGGCR